MFKETMEKIGEPVAPSEIVEDVKHGLEVSSTDRLSGGSSSCLYTWAVPAAVSPITRSSVRRSLKMVFVFPVWDRFLVERCIAGWKEIEYEVMRDGAGNCDHRLQHGKHRPGRCSYR